MYPVLNLLAPLVLLLPSAVAVEPSRAMTDSAGTYRTAIPSGPISRPNTGEVLVIPEAQQVRIEQRVTIRVSPRVMPTPFQPSMFDDDFGGGRPRFIERKLGKCLPLSGIAGVQSASGSKLLLIMRDSRLVTATLEKGCRGKDFYSGFLVEKNTDGMVCTGRDELLSRSGSSCQVSGFRQLVPLGV